MASIKKILQQLNRWYRKIKEKQYAPSSVHYEKSLEPSNSRSEKELFGKTRQAWYKAIQRSEWQQMQALLVIHEVKKIRKNLPRCGVRKLYYLLGDFLRQHQIKLGRDKLFALLSEHNLLIKRKKTRRTTFS